MRAVRVLDRQQGVLGGGAGAGAVGVARRLAVDPLTAQQVFAGRVVGEDHGAAGLVGQARDPAGVVGDVEELAGGVRQAGEPVPVQVAVMRLPLGSST